jgi:uncharacterized protein
MSHELFLCGWELEQKGNVVEALKFYDEAKLMGDKCSIFHWNCMDLKENVNNRMNSKMKLNDEEFQCLYGCYKDIDKVEIQYNLGLLYYIHNYDEKAFYYWTLPSMAHYAPAHISLGHHHYSCTKQYDKAFEHFQIASANNEARGLCWLGICYYEGKGTDKNDVEALRYFMLASHKDEARAQYHLAYMYQVGIVVEQNYNRALEYYFLASRYDKRAEAQVGLFYDNGYGVKQNYEEAIRWYQLAIEHGSVNALCNLGLMFFDGHGVQKDYIKAVELIDKAIKLGNKEAIGNLNRILSIQDKIKQKLDTYIQITEYEGISYLLFANFLKYLNQHNITDCDQPLLRSWITDTLMTYFKVLNPEFLQITIDEWFQEFYGLE